MKAGPTPVVKAVFHLVDILDVVFANAAQGPKPLISKRNQAILISTAGRLGNVGPNILAIWNPLVIKNHLLVNFNS
jgi:hypothetical protein